MDGSDRDLDAQAQILLDSLRPRRRVRPRLAPPLIDAEDREIETFYGPVRAWRTPGRPITLAVHGWEDDNCLWGPFIERCAEIGRGVVAFDLPGHGFSQAEAAMPVAAAAAVRAVAEAMGPIDSIIAHSFGGMASVIALAEGLGVERVVTIASGAHDGRAWAERFVERGASREVVDRAHALHQAATGTASFAPDITLVLPQMTARALIMHSTDDEVVSVDHAYRIADLWPGAKLALYDDLGHRPIAQDPAVLDRAVAFLEGGD